MPIPIICADAPLRQFAACFRSCFNRVQAQYFVTVLLALVCCLEAKTLAALQRTVVADRALSGFSRFLGRAPWDPAAVAAVWTTRFREQVAPAIAAEQARLGAQQPRRRGRRSTPLVTGYLIGDDSTMHKPKGRWMQGLGCHYSSTAQKPLVGHSLVAMLYVVLGRRCVQAPQLYEQQASCERAGGRFQSKLDLLVQLISAFVPPAGTRTHVLVDSWYSAKKVWQAARERGFLITSGLKSNRSIRVPDATSPHGWRWQSLPEYTASLTAADYIEVAWPRGEATGQRVYVHVVRTQVRKLYTSQVVIVRERLDGPLRAVRYWASSDLTADAGTLLGHIAARWEIEVLFADGKELLGWDQYQVMSRAGIVRWWTLGCAAYQFLEEEQARQQATAQRGAEEAGREAAEVTLGEARQAVQRRHRRRLVAWLYEQFQQSTPLEQLYDLLAS